MEIHKPYLLFLGDAPDDLAAKTAIGVYEWRGNECVGQLRLPGCVPRLPLPEMSVAEAVGAGARTMLVGVANRGGVIPRTWHAPLVEALDSGLDLASGLHTRLSEVDVIREAAARNGRALHDVRHPRQVLEVASGEPRPGHRVLTVGTDCSVGKMYASLALHREFVARGVAADFRATGQTGILIAGGGISVDAVVADFISGAVEWLAPANDSDHWDVIEGQGSLFHPSFAGVSLGLLHGANPDFIVMCHEPTRTHMRGLPRQRVPGLQECIEANLDAARVVRTDTRCAGIAINTRALVVEAALKLLREIEDDLGMPCVDPVRTGAGPLVEHMLAAAR